LAENLDSKPKCWEKRLNTQSSICLVSLVCVSQCLVVYACFCSLYMLWRSLRHTVVDRWVGTRGGKRASKAMYRTLCVCIYVCVCVCVSLSVYVCE
jgi:hypothetical protein